MRVQHFKYRTTFGRFKPYKRFGEVLFFDVGQLGKEVKFIRPYNTNIVMEPAYDLL